MEQHFGATDITDIDSALKQAPEKVLEKLNKSFNHIMLLNLFIDFKVYTGTSDLIDCFSYNTSIFQILTAIGEKTFKTWSDNLEYFKDDYNSDYEYEFGIEPDIVEMKKIFDFSSIKGCNDIMWKYTDNYIITRFRR